MALSLQENFDLESLQPQLKPTPPWLFVHFPAAPQELPAHVVDDLEGGLMEIVATFEHFPQFSSIPSRQDRIRALEAYFIAVEFMNNFFLKLVWLPDHFDLLSPMPSIPEMTCKQFADEAESILRDHGLSSQEARRIFIESKTPQFSTNTYLFPLFLELLRRGYRRYPDLAA